MARPSRLVDTKISTLNIQKSDINYLNENGYNRSEFLRQAVKALQNGEWKYER